MKDRLDRQRYGFPDRVSAGSVLSDSLVRLIGVKAGADSARPEGSVLFREGQKVLGIFIIREGRVKLSIGSGNGKALILGVFGCGAVLGLPAALLDRPHAATAEVVESAKVSFLSRGDLLRNLRTSERAAWAAAEMVSEMSYSILAAIKIIHLSQSAEQRMARFLLQLRPVHKSPKGETHVVLELNQEEIGQMVGLSRETVARVLSGLRKRRILEVRTPIFMIHDRSALARLAGVPEERDHGKLEA